MVNTSQQDTDTTEKDGAEGELSRYVFGSGYPPIGSDEASNSPYCSAPAELAKNAGGVEPIQPGNYYITDSNGFVDIQATENERARIEAAEQASAGLADAFLGTAVASAIPGAAVGNAFFGADESQEQRPSFLSEATAAMQNMLPFVMSFDANPQEVLPPMATPVLEIGPSLGISGL